MCREGWVQSSSHDQFLRRYSLLSGTVFIQCQLLRRYSLLSGTVFIQCQFLRRYSLLSGTVFIQCQFLRRYSLLSGTVYIQCQFLRRYSLLSGTVYIQCQFLRRYCTVTPILKRPPPSFVTNYRAIFITSVLSKLFECPVSVRLGRFMERSGVLPTTQFNYWKGLGTCDALLCVSHIHFKCIGDWAGD